MLQRRSDDWFHHGSRPGMVNGGLFDVVVVGGHVNACSHRGLGSHLGFACFT